MITPKQTTAFLRQLKTGTIYAWTPQLARRPDMIPYDEREAKLRIQGVQERIKRLKSLGAADRLKSSSDQVVATASLNSIKLAHLESEVEALEEKYRKAQEAEVKRQEAIDKGDAPPPEDKEEMTLEEKAEAERQKKIEADPEIQKIRNFRSKKEISEYLMEWFGIEADPENEKMVDLVEKAVEARTKRIFELED